MVEHINAKLLQLGQTQVKAQVKTIEAGIEKDLPNKFELHIDGQSRNVSLYDSAAKQYAKETMSFDGCNGVYDSTITLHFFADYRRIKEHLTFRRIYGYKQRNVNYCTADGEKPVFMDTFPCMKCGVVLPEYLVTIDHQKPQAGGEAQAVAKVFRAFRLTNEGPKGQKGQAFNFSSDNELTQALIADNVGKTIVPFAQKYVGVSKNERNTLNISGIIAYSTIIWLGLRASLFSNCMHSLLNLKPLCTSCNSSKGNIL